VPTQEAINKLIAARLAADVCDVPTVLIARTDAESADLLEPRMSTSAEPALHRHPPGAAPRKGFLFFRFKAGTFRRRSPAAAPMLRTWDLLWCERPPRGREPGGGPAEFAAGNPRPVPGQDAGVQLLAVLQLGSASSRMRKIARIPARTGARWGYRFQFITLAGFSPPLNFFDVRAGARLLQGPGRCPRTCSCSRQSFAAEASGYTPPPSTSAKVGAGYFDAVHPGGNRRNFLDLPHSAAATEGAAVREGGFRQGVLKRHLPRHYPATRRAGLPAYFLAVGMLNSAPLGVPFPASRCMMDFLPRVESARPPSP